MPERRGKGIFMERRVKVYLTDIRNGRRLSEETPLVFKADKSGNDGNEGHVLNVYDQVKYQEILGFGGAFTQAAAVNYKKLDEAQREEVLTAYFDREKGLGYSFCRLTINSCDFSTEMYSYDDTPEDFELKDFSIARDREDVIPMVHAAREKASELLLFASPWSPPAWMKTNGKMDKGGFLRADCRQVWADYTARYLQAYEKEGTPIWGVTVQNEAKAEQGWESCHYEAGEERDFVTGFLKPAYEKAGLGDRKIFFWDHNKERAVDRGLETLCNERSRAAFDGMAVHWYSGDHFGALDVFHRLYPEKLLIASEQCKGREKLPWESGEAYAHDIIGDLNNWVSAWVDWNMLLDENGGPDHWLDEQLQWESITRKRLERGLEIDWKKEDFRKLMEEEGIWFGESPLLCDHGEKSLHYASSYYYIGHFSRFIKRGAKRIGSSVYTSDLEVCAFQNPDGSIAAVAMNASEEVKKVVLRFHEEIAQTFIPAHSIVTFVF